MTNQLLNLAGQLDVEIDDTGDSIAMTSNRATVFVATNSHACVLNGDGLSRKELVTGAFQDLSLGLMECTLDNCHDFSDH
jgi:hypothetical protein